MRVGASVTRRRAACRAWDAPATAEEGMGVVACMVVLPGSVFPEPALAQVHARRHPDVVVIEIAAVRAGVAGGAVGRALDAGVVSERGGALAVLALDPGRAREAVLGRLLDHTLVGAGVRLQPGAELFDRGVIQRGVGAVVLVQAGHDPLPRTGGQQA